MLPTTKTPRQQSLGHQTILLYGPTKFGKSSLCAQAENALFLPTEPGLNHLEVYQAPIDSWEKLLAVAGDIAKGDHPFETVVLDTVDNAYLMCAEHICRRHQIQHESDLEYGKGYALVNTEFRRVLTKLAMLRHGLILVSHAQEKEVETRTGKRAKTVPTLPDKARKLVLGLVDLILFCDFEITTGSDGKPIQRRVMRTKPTAAYDAGDRSGLLPEVLDFDYRAFVDAFARATSRDASAGAPPASSAAGRRASAATAPPEPNASPAPTTAAAPDASNQAAGTAVQEAATVLAGGAVVGALAATVPPTASAPMVAAAPPPAARSPNTAAAPAPRAAPTRAPSTAQPATSRPAPARAAAATTKPNTAPTPRTPAAGSR